jgi:NitT/TauT family transport system substrate-binding protein
MKKIMTEGLGPSAIFALPWRVGQDEGLFAQEGIAVEFVDNRSRQDFVGTLQRPEVVESIRTHAPFEEGEVDIYRACEWGQIRRAFDSQRGGRILGKRSSIAIMAIMSGPNSRFTYPQTLRNQPISVSFYNGNHYATLQMLEGFMPRKEISVIGQHTVDGYNAVLSGDVAAIALSEPWVTIAEKQGFQKVIETHYAGMEIGAPEIDAETYAAVVRVQKQAIRRINSDKRKYLHYLIESVPEPFRGVITEDDFHLPRLRFVDPEPYSPEEFTRTYQWMRSWDLIAPDVKYDQIVRPVAWAASSFQAAELAP